uniref:Uncharacterized protein n=1 Tax=Arundo donax TaxID=35708 RepID=A0A0A8YUW5_ARUDO
MNLSQCVTPIVCAPASIHALIHFQFIYNRDQSYTTFGLHEK